MPVPHDERLSMPVEQQALLWCMRVWVAGLHRPIEAGPRIQGMMTRLGAPGAAPFFEGMMFALRHGAARPLAVGCVCRSHLSDDERMLLETLGLAQACRLFEALLTLRGILTPEGARAALRSAAQRGAAGRQLGPGGPLPAGARSGGAPFRPRFPRRRRSASPILHAALNRGAMPAGCLAMQAGLLQGAPQVPRPLMRAPGGQTRPPAAASPLRARLIHCVN